MVYAELVLERTVDWRSMKASKKLVIPTTKDIPRAPLSINPRDGLGPKKHIIEGVANEDYVWSSSDDSMEEDTLDPIPPMEETSLDENTALVVFEGENVRGDIPMDVEPLAAVEPMPVSHLLTHEAEQHVEARLRKMAQDDFYFEIEPEPTSQLMLKWHEDEVDDWIPEVVPHGEPDDYVYNEPSKKSMKKKYKAQLKDFLAQIEEKNMECQILLDRTTKDIETNDVPSLQELIEAGLTRLAVQQQEMANLEEFYLTFNKGQDGGSSSNPKQVRKKELHKIIEKCRMEETRGNDERQSLEVAQSRLNHLHSMKDKAPLARTLEFDAACVDGQQQTSPSELAELKEMWNSLKMLEAEYEKSIKWKKQHISFYKVFKPFLIKNKRMVPSALKQWHYDKERVSKEMAHARAGLQGEGSERTHE